jgi:hypothetical protein
MKAFVIALLAACGLASAAVWTQYPVAVGTNGVASFTMDDRFSIPAEVDSMWFYKNPASTNESEVAVLFKERSWFETWHCAAIVTNAANASVMFVGDIGLVVKRGDTLTFSNTTGSASIILNVKRE